MTSLLAVGMYNHIYDRVENAYYTGDAILDITIGGQKFSPELNPIQEQTILNNGRMGFQLGQYKEDMYSPEGLLIHKKGDAYVVEPGEDNQVHVYAKSSAFKPYLGFGYGGRLIASAKTVMTGKYRSMLVCCSGVRLISIPTMARTSPRILRTLKVKWAIMLILLEA